MQIHRWPYRRCQCYGCITWPVRPLYAVPCVSWWMDECGDIPTLTATCDSKIFGVPKTWYRTVSEACRFDIWLNKLPYLLTQSWEKFWTLPSAQPIRIPFYFGDWLCLRLQVQRVKWRTECGGPVTKGESQFQKQTGSLQDLSRL